MYLGCDFYTASETGDVVSSSDGVVVEDEGGCVVEAVC
jgi:hypothetical protein